MNKLLNETVTRNGRIYHYDPDADVYYSGHQPQGHWDAFGWIYAVLVLAVICYCVEYWI